MSEPVGVGEIPIRTDNLNVAVSNIKEVKMWQVERIEVPIGGNPSLIRTFGRGPCSVFALSMFSPTENAAVISHSPEMNKMMDMRIRNRVFSFLEHHKVVFARGLWISEVDDVIDEVSFSEVKRKLADVFRGKHIPLTIKEMTTESYGPGVMVPNVGILLEPPDSKESSRFIIDNHGSFVIEPTPTQSEKLRILRD